MKVYKVHPFAEMYPMLEPDQLQELADDIKVNGQRLPIIINKDDFIIDGRNRLAACEIAGVEPEFELYHDGDERDYILSLNVNRRHMNKGQRAMAVAMVYPEPSKGGRGKINSSKIEEIHQGTLSMARAVLRRLPDYALDVLHGRTSLTDAFKKIDELDELQARIDRLRELHPDLADRVKDGEITISEAEKLAFPRKTEGVADAELMCLNVSGAYSKLVEDINEVDTFADRLTETHIGAIVEVLMKIAEKARSSSVELSKRCGKTSHLIDVSKRKV